MIVGIGTDIVENKRIKAACLKAAFLKRVFTEEEQKLIRRLPEKACGNFAVKEAVSKAFGTGLRQMKLFDIEVLRDELGKPFVNLYGLARKKAEELEIDVIHVSISNTNELTIAYVVAEKNS